jgi:hypothetical protein
MEGLSPHFIMNTLISEFELKETGRFRAVMDVNDVLAILHHHWVLSDADRPSTTDDSSKQRKDRQVGVSARHSRHAMSQKARVMLQSSTWNNSDRSQGCQPSVSPQEI